MPIAGRGAVAGTAAEAVGLFAELGGPVVVKPRHGRQGRHVALDLAYAGAETRSAFTAEPGGDVIVERQLAGPRLPGARRGRRGGRGRRTDRRARHRRRPQHGRRADRPDQRRPAAGRRPLPGADPDHGGRRGRCGCSSGRACGLDRGAGRRPPASGCATNANLSTGGTSHDVTDRVHPDVARLCLRVTGLVGLDIAGIDLRLPDIAEPLPPAADEPTRSPAG